MDDDVSCTELPESCRWFGPLAQILTVIAIGLTGTYVSLQMLVGQFPWWPYPAFTLFTALLFWAHGLVSRQGAKDDRNSQTRL